jgi:hypothetical protein
VKDKPDDKLDGGMDVFLEDWGVVTLLRMAQEEQGHVVFRCVDAEGVMELELAAWEEWCVCVAKDVSGFSGIWRFVTALFHRVVTPQISKEVVHLLTPQHARS